MILRMYMYVYMGIILQLHAFFGSWYSGDLCLLTMNNFIHPFKGWGALLPFLGVQCFSKLVLLHPGQVFQIQICHLASVCGWLSSYSVGYN